MSESWKASGLPVMEQKVSLDYHIVASPIQQRFEEVLLEGRITGHRCPRCHMVYVPPKGFCALCCVITGRDCEVDVSDRGIVTSFTVITPIQYPGQKETEPYALVSLLLDGANSTVGQQRIGGMPREEVRTGLRVGAEWAPREERTTSGEGRGGGFEGVIVCWVPTGEPDAEPEEYLEHIL